MTTETPGATHASPRALPAWIVTLLWLLVMLGLPAFLVLTGVRLVMTDTFLQIEYHRPGFPEDRYGFTQADRLQYAPYAVDYLRNDAGISYLGDLEFPDGEPLYRPKELQHMQDVKVVTRAALRIHTALTIGLFAIVLIALWAPAARVALWRGLADGGGLTIALILALVIVMLLNWDFFFEGFHRIFFKGNSWQFYTSDTLIRLFPQQFWFDAAVAIGTFTVVGAIVAIAAGRWWEGRTRRLAA